MQRVDTLIECRWLVPVQPRQLVLEHHAVVVDAGRIVAIEPIEQAKQRYSAQQTHALANHVVTPGLVNAHNHAAMTLLRGVGDDLPLMQWLQTRIWPLESALVSDEFVFDGSRLAALEMLRAGTTTCSDMYFHPTAALRGLRAMGMRAAAGMVVIEFPTSYASDPDDYLRKGLAARDAMADDPLVSFTIAPHAPYTVADPTLARIVTLAEELDLPIHMHIQETTDEITQSLKQYGVRPLQRLERLGLVSERLIAVHAVHLNQTEIALLAQRGASVAHCPSSNLKLASGIAPVAALLDAGVNVSIGTDGAASNNRLDSLHEMRLAALLAKGQTGNAAALPAWQALECATLSGAKAIGLERRIGSIEVGKEADLAAFDVSSAETQPCYDPVSHLVYACGREHVSDVWVAGRHVVQKRQLAGVDSEALSAAVMAQAQHWQQQAQPLLKPAAATNLPT